MKTLITIDEINKRFDEGKATHSFGKSMYGGWYMEWGYNNAKHFDTLKELKKFAEENDIFLFGREDH